MPWIRYYAFLFSFVFVEFTLMHFVPKVNNNVKKTFISIASKNSHKYVEIKTTDFLRCIHSVQK